MSESPIYQEWIEIVKSDDKSKSLPQEPSVIFFKCLILFVIFVFMIQIILWLFKIIPGCFEDDEEDTTNDASSVTDELPVQQSSSSITMDNALMSSLHPSSPRSPVISFSHLNNVGQFISNNSGHPKSPSAMIRVTEVYFK